MTKIKMRQPENNRERFVINSTDSKATTDKSPSPANQRIINHRTWPGKKWLL